MDETQIRGPRIGPNSYAGAHLVCLGLASSCLILFFVVSLKLSTNGLTDSRNWETHIVFGDHARSLARGDRGLNSLATQLYNASTNEAHSPGLQAISAQRLSELYFMTSDGPSDQSFSKAVQLAEAAIAAEPLASMKQLAMVSLARSLRLKAVWLAKHRQFAKAVLPLSELLGLVNEHSGNLPYQAYREIVEADRVIIDLLRFDQRTSSAEREALQKVCNQLCASFATTSYAVNVVPLTPDGNAFVEAMQLGENCVKRKDFRKAILYFQSANSLADSMGSPGAVVRSACATANAQCQLNDLKSCCASLELALASARRINNLTMQEQILKTELPLLRSQDQNLKRSIAQANLLFTQEKLYGLHFQMLPELASCLAAEQEKLGRFREATQLAELAHRAAVAQRQTNALVMSLQVLAPLEQRNGRLAVAEDAYRQLLSFSTFRHDLITPKQSRECLKSLCTLYENQQRYRDSIAAVQAYIAPRTPSPDADLVTAQIHLSNLYRTEKRYQEALKAAEQALEWNEHLPDRLEHKAEILKAVALSHLRLHNYAQAESLMEQVLEIRLARGDRAGYAESLSKFLRVTQSVLDSETHNDSRVQLGVILTKLRTRAKRDDVPI